MKLKGPVSGPFFFCFRGLEHLQDNKMGRQRNLPAHSDLARLP